MRGRWLLHTGYLFTYIVCQNNKDLSPADSIVLIPGYIWLKVECVQEQLKKVERICVRELKMCKFSPLVNCTCVHVYMCVWEGERVCVCLCVRERENKSEALIRLPAGLKQVSAHRCVQSIQNRVRPMQWLCANYVWDCSRSFSQVQVASWWSRLLEHVLSLCLAFSRCLLDMPGNFCCQSGMCSIP